MDRNTLAKGFVYGFAEDIIEVIFTAEDQRKAVKGVILVVHQHLDIIQDTGVEILSFINSEEKRLAFLSIEIIDLLLDSAEHTGLSTLVADAEDFAELPVEFCNTDSRETDIVHVKEIGVKGLSKAAEGKGFAHTGSGSKNAYASNIFEIIKPALHGLKVSRTKLVFHLKLLLIKGVEAEGIIVNKSIHKEKPPQRNLE